MVTKSNPLLAYAEALLVTFLWSSSYVLIKIGLLEIPPFLFAAVRYTFAFAILGMLYLSLGSTGKTDPRIKTYTNGKLLLLAAGICGYTLAQGLQFVGLFYLPAVTTSFLLNFTPVFVLVLGILFLGERASKLQLLGLALALVGAYAFFSEKLAGAGQQFGVAVVIVSGFSWAIYLVIIRRIQRVDSFGSLRLTTVTMGIGTAGLVLLAAIFDGPRPISFDGLMIILWLSVVNTALAFLLWNHALRSIHACELSVIQNSMMVQIALLAWIFLDELLTYVMVVGIVLVIVGILMVQIPITKRVKHRSTIVAPQ
jgi:drug/metabolite transporter (DMT)-like permease